MKLTRSASSLFIIFTLLSIGSNPNSAAAEINWNNVEAKTFKVFYPGVASWEFLRSEDHGRGANVVKKREKACVECHVSKEGSYDVKADKIISGELKKAQSKQDFEPKPMAGTPGFKEVKIQVAYDQEKIYFRFQWPGSGASVSDSSIADNGKPDRIALQISEKIGTFRNYGCFITCHNDENGMPDNKGEQRKLYGYYTRTDDGAIQPQDKLSEFITKGQFIDLWMATFEGKTVKAHDYYILQDRLEDRNDLTATGGFENGTYTVVISRKLSTGDDKDVELSPGSAFSIGVAIHDNQNNGRRHYTSFPMSIGLSSTADINASKF